MHSNLPAARWTVPMGLALLAGLIVAACSGLTLSNEETEPTLVGPDGENTPILCSDGIDNDGNGYADCGDFSCDKTAACE